ncbi:hypothetical protein KA093_00010 [Candidatus Saccharibacteria bacterium]|nr:hypothetical protein [Candidatus Saccharibacteria bacterium]
MFRYASPGIRRRLIAVVFVLGTLIANVLFSHDGAYAATGINQQMNFQGRLYTASGATVPDGYYNLQFKIYQDGAGTAAGNPGGTLKWTEDWTNAGGHGVQVINGFISVQLGSVTPFGSSVDWNQDTLWLSMNVGNTNVSCTPFSSCGGDGEMVPMKRLSSTPYALNAGMLGGLTSSGFIQSTTTPQTANIAVQSAAAGNVGAVIQAASAQSANLLELRDSSNNVNVAFNAEGNQLTLGRIAASGTVTQGRLVLSDGTTDNFGLTVLSGVQTGNYTLTLPSLAGNATVCTSNSTATANCGNFIQNQTTLQSASNFYISGTGKTDTAFVTPAVRAAVDSTTALKIQNAAGSTDIVTVDTTNSRIGIGTTAAPTTTLQVSVNNTVTSNPQLLLEQSGSGDASVQIKTNAESWLLGADTSDNSTFKINSSLSANTTTPFGNTTTGTATDNDDNNRLEAGKYLSSVSGNIVALSAYMTCPISTAPNNQFRMALFTDNSGTPGTLITQSSASTLATGWNTVSVPAATVSSGTVYWIIYLTNGTATNQNCFRTTTGGGTNSSTWTNNGITFGTIAATWPGNAGGTPTNDLPSFYASVQTTSSYDSFGNSLFQLTNTGRLTLRNYTDSVGALNIQNAAGSNILNVDTTNSRVGIAIASTEASNYDLTFGGGGNRVIGVNANTTTGTGRSLTVQAGAGNAGVGGTLTLQGGAGNGSFAGGAVQITGGTAGGGNTAGGAVSLQGGTAAGTGTGGTASLLGGAASATAASNGGSVAITAANGTTTTTGGNGGNVTITAGNGTGTGTRSGGNISLVAGATSATGTGATVAGIISLQGGTANTLNTTGGAITLTGGTGNGTGNGGAITITGGTGGASGVTGLIGLNPTAFTSSTGQNIAVDTTLALSLVNGNSTIPVNATTASLKITVPTPTTATVGRILYITASNTSNDFSLLLANTSGVSASYTVIGMRQNNTATLIWNGYAWTAAGASSSTDLQSAYNNTLQSAGGAELVVSKTSATNGLTIRDSTVNSVDGTLLSVQTKSASGLFQVNSNVTEYVTNAGAETAGASSSTFPSSTWAAVGSSTVSRNTTTNNNSIATGQASVSVGTTGAAQDGVKNTLSTTLGTKQNYNVSFTARLSSGTFTDMNVYYSVDGTAASVACTTSQAIATSVWTKVNCSFTAPASGITSSNAILIRQTGTTARTFYIDNLSVTIAADYNYATDGNVNDSGNFATNWSAVSGSTITRSTTVGNDASDSAQAVTAATAGQGVRNKLSISPLASTLYRVTVYAASSNSFSDFTVRYSRDGGTNFAACADYNTQTLSTTLTSFTKITCYITTDASAATNPYVYFTQNTGTARTFYVDTFSMTLASNTTPNVQIGGGVNGGPTTLFTLDRGASAPIASNNDALLGSMYYDTTLGKLQCYEADGWGACGSSPDNIVTISPEYTNAVLHGTGIGTMTSDLCSDYLNINDGSGSPAQPTICGTNETYNFYKWTSPQATAQTYAIYVTYQLPSTFKEFNSGQTSLMGRTDNGSNGGSATVQYQIYRNSGTGLTACGSTISVSTGTQTSWQIGNATGAADPSTCGFAPGNSIVFKIDMTTSKNANAYVGNLNFAFSNK